MQDSRLTLARLTLARLRALDAVARHGSLSEAADQLGTPTAAVSEDLQALEQAYTMRLFEPRGDRVVATRDLDRVLPRVRALLALSEDLDAHLGRQGAGQSGPLRVGYATAQVARPILSRLPQALPGLALTTRMAATQDLLQMLDAAEIDAAFVVGRKPPSRLTRVHVATSRIVLAVPAAHPLAGTGPVAWSTVSGVPLIQRDTASGTSRLFGAAAKTADAALDTRVVLGSWGAIAAMVRAGLGAGVGLDAEVQQTDDLVAVPIADPSLKADHFLVCLPDRTNAPAVHRLFKLAREDAKAQIPVF